MKKLGKYEILSELGHGAMGVVYKARDPLIDRRVALKTINPSLVDRPELLERFYQEAQSAGKLQHPNIVTIFELGKAADTPYIAMEFIDGESLEKSISCRRDLPLALKVGYIVRICQALGYAHRNRVVHRDVKPANIMVDSHGAVKVVDFGIARLIDFSRTSTSMMIGTPAYMAPELFNQGKADDRSDIWAVGITLYELICLRRPFVGEGYGLIRSINEDRFADASSIVPECPSELDAVVRRMLQKNRGERYPSMEDTLMDLEPVWNRLRSDSVTSLTQRAQALYDGRELAKAEELLRTARLVDPSDKAAKSLLEKVSTELRRSQVLPRLEPHLNRGRTFLQSRQFREAQAEAEAALALDSHNEIARQLAEAAGAALLAQRQRDLQQRIQEIRGRINREELSDAVDLAQRSLHEFGPDTDVTQLLQVAQFELQEREKKAAQAKSQSASQPFNPTDLLGAASPPSSAGETSDHDVPPAAPLPPETPIAPAPALASATLRMEASVPVLTPPPTPQPRTVSAQEQVPLDLPAKETPVPRRRSSFPGRSMLAWGALILLLAAGAYKFVSVKQGNPSAPQMAQRTIPEKALEAAATSGAKVPTETTANAIVVPPAAAQSVSPDEQRANNALTQAISAFNRHDYNAAKAALDQALARSPQNWSARPQAADLLSKTQNRFSQQQHLRQAQTFLAAGNYDAAKAEANQAITAQDGDPSFSSQASQLIAKIPVQSSVISQPPPTQPAAVAAATPAKDFKPLAESIAAAINRGQLDDAQAKLNTLPADYPGYNAAKQSLADAREDQAFSQKKSDLAQAENTRNETALHSARDYFNALASQLGRHSSEARALTSQIDSDLKALTAANPPPSSAPSPTVSPGRDDGAEILAALNRYAAAISKGDIEQVKSVRTLTPSEEKRLRDTFQQRHGQGVPTKITNCKTPQFSAELSTVNCTVASGDLSPRPVSFSLSRSESGEWHIVSTSTN